MRANVPTSFMTGGCAAGEGTGNSGSSGGGHDGEVQRNRLNVGRIRDGRFPGGLHGRVGHELLRVHRRLQPAERVEHDSGVGVAVAPGILG